MPSPTSFRASLASAALACVTSLPFASSAFAATITREIAIDAEPAKVWDAIRDVGAVDKRIAPGFVVSEIFDGRVRVVTFAKGKVVREVIVSIDERTRRVAYASIGGTVAHHNASMQVFASGRRTRVVWITDVLPDTAGPAIATLMDQGLVVMKRTLERR